MTTLIPKYDLGSTGAVNRPFNLKLSELISVKDYGAKGDGVTDDTTAIQTALNNNGQVYFPPGVYSVSSITFPATEQTILFDQATLLGNATTATNCIVQILSSGANIYNLEVNLNWNTNYICAVWWYNATAASQYNNIFGMFIKYGDRGLVYGALPGNSNTAYAQSENQVFGFRTRGLQRPFYNNHNLGHLFFSNPIFVSYNEEWVANGKTFDWTVATAYENTLGQVTASGGEIQRSGSTLGLSASVQSSIFLGMKIETAAPIHITGDQVWFIGCICLMTVDSINFVNYYSGVSGARLYFDHSKVSRPSGVGNYDSSAMINATAASSSNEIYLNNCDIVEWRWSNSDPTSELIEGGTPYYQNTRLNITAADSNIYHINNLRENLLVSKGVNQLGSTTTGWYTNGSSPTLSVTTTAPTNYSTSLSLTSTGVAAVLTMDTTSSSTIKSTGFSVRSAELYSLQCWILNGASGASSILIASFYDRTGTFISTSTIAATNEFTGTTWSRIFVPIVVPANACFMGVGAQVNNATVYFTDMNLFRASN